MERLVTRDEDRRRRLWRLGGSLSAAGVAGALLCGVTWRLSAQTDTPDINACFVDPDLDVERWVAIFESESREIYASRASIVRAVGLKPGMAVADVGAGTGLFVRPFAQQVGPQGQVYAVEISRRFLEYIARQAKASGLDQVRTVRGREDSIGLPADSVDVVFMCDTYHHFTRPQANLASIHRALRSGGRLIVVDFIRDVEITRSRILDHVRAGKDVVVNEIVSAGFRLVDEPDISGLQENYVVRFAKR